jgi:glycerol-1-phosphate dehydrogenase [NAD(P)+]
VRDDNKKEGRMTQEIIQKIIAGHYHDDENDTPLDIPITHISIASGASKKAQQLLTELNADSSNLLLVCDENTHKALGGKIAEQISPTHTIILPAGIHPDIKHVDEITNIKASFIVAVGSGTINDLCKYSAHLLEVPYVIFGTAPSMNGYASGNASIVTNKHKQTLGATLPQAVVLDLDILAAAPKRMIQAGIGDSLCRSTCQVDWLLSHFLFDTPYSATPFELLKDVEKKLLAHTAEAVNGDKDAIETLAITLVLSGIGMYISGGSYPASQAEHLVAHYIEMMSDEAQDTLHGEEIAVTTLQIAQMQGRILRKKTLNLKPFMPDEEYMLEHFGTELGSSLYKDVCSKAITAENAEETNHYLDEKWDEIRKYIKTFRLPAATLHAAMKDAGMGASHSKLGWPDDLYKNALSISYLTRDRFTILDIYRIGIYDNS